MNIWREMITLNGTDKVHRTSKQTQEKDDLTE